MKQIVDMRQKGETETLSECCKYNGLLKVISSSSSNMMIDRE